MIAVDPSQLLAAWEEGLGFPAGRRSLRLVSLARPDLGWRELENLSVGQVDSLLLDLRESLFGSHLTALTACPACSNDVEIGFTVGMIRAEQPAEPKKDPLSIRIDECDITYRLPTVLDLDDIRSSSRKKGSRGLLERCIVTAARDGHAITLADLPETAASAIGAAMERADPQAATQLAMRCPECEHRWNEVFDPGAYLWNELEAWAKGMLAEIDTIARAYGWSEAEILSLSPRRRRSYLEIIRQ